MRRVAAAASVGFAMALAACATLKQAVTSPTIAQVAPEPPVPLAAPTETMKAGKGEADAAYPPDFGVTVRSDGSIVFPQHTVGRIKGAALLVGGDTVLTVGADGEVKGVALKHRYKFDDEGALLDDQGRGVRLAPDGGVRGVGGEWKYRDVLAWAPEGGGKWDDHAWRTLAIVSLVLIENMLPQAIREKGKEAGDGGKDKGLTINIPPPSEWFK